MTVHGNTHTEAGGRGGESEGKHRDPESGEKVATAPERKSRARAWGEA